MALLYPWATKEYLLWKMSIGQIIMYLNVGYDVQNPKPKDDGKLVGKSHSELKAIKDDMIKNGLIEVEIPREQLIKKYGDIDAK